MTRNLSDGAHIMPSLTPPLCASPIHPPNRPWQPMHTQNKPCTSSVARAAANVRNSDRRRRPTECHIPVHTAFITGLPSNEITDAQGLPPPAASFPGKFESPHHHFVLLVDAPPSTAVLIILCISVSFFSSSSIWACTRLIPTEFSVTVSATSVEIPFTLSARICAY